MSTRSAILLQAAAFVLLAAAGVGWAAWSVGLSPDDLRPLAQLDAARVAALVFMAGFFYVADLLRYRAFAAALRLPLGWRGALDAAITCNFLAMLTPGGTFGIPGAIYMLRRSGMPLPSASLVAFLKSSLGSIGLLLAAFAAFGLGLGPRLDGPVIALFVSTTALLGVLLLPVIAVAALPQRAHALLDWIDARAGETRWLRGAVAQARTLIDRMRELRPSSLPLLVAVNALYFANLIGMLVLIAATLGARPLDVTAGISTLYLAFVYVAPTPGGSGLAEGVASSFFARVLPPTAGLASVLAFRMLTAWLQIAVGAVHLVWVGGLDEILRRQR